MAEALFTNGKTASVHGTNIEVKPGADCLVAAAARQLGVDESAQEGSAPGR
jgi:hypothetical protein